ncbi:MAG: ATP-binding cassette domain-containing protein [Parvularculales bacterium]
MIGIDSSGLNLTAGTVRHGIRKKEACLFHNLSLSLPARRLTALLGRSGVGKSSLLRLLAGLTPPPRSAMIYDGIVTQGDNTPATGHIALMDQRDLLLPWASVLDNVVIGARLRAERVDADRARALLDAVGLLECAYDRPEKLSGGMRQRVMLARTLYEDQPIVLMDEPFSSLDAVTRQHLQELTLSLLADRTVLLITHDPLEALRAAHQIYVMVGTPAHLVYYPVPGKPPPRDLNLAALRTAHSDLMNQLSSPPTMTSTS